MEAKLRGSMEPVVGLCDVLRVVSANRVSNRARDLVNPSLCCRQPSAGRDSTTGAATLLNAAAAGPWWPDGGSPPIHHRQQAVIGCVISRLVARKGTPIDSGHAGAGPVEYFGPLEV
ncbi:hypothetical protein Pyn_19933 [Prunus yedoensis var. nudiflora]|uniref:Uncharacterized protein n=1 Tax=Prunus yedoensis var. nudiflora TaxID=2094558 RepID=A0A314Z3F2_PRUYE|nr:hypothetical protein Pyn_19933 [Prunus yedoensis var. nudiflora]